MILFILILISVILILLFKNELNKSKYQRQGREEITDQEYPYILKGFSGVYDSPYSKYNFKVFEEASTQALELTTKIGFDGLRVDCDKSEIWFKGRLLKSFITNHRVNINNIEGFNRSIYDGEVFINHQLNIDLAQICSSKSITIMLSNGEIHILEKPFYSLQENCLRALFITYLKESNRIKTQDYRCFPINIIDKIVNSKTLK